jgi:hypothetical protein
MFHSERKLLTGFVMAALITWKLIDIVAIDITINPVTKNIHPEIKI